MTSVLKRYNALDERTRYFRVLTETIATFVLRNGVTTGVIDIADISGTTTVTLNPTYTLLKDLGRTVYVHDSNIGDESPAGPRVAILREVQLVNGPVTEGVSGNATNMFNSYWIASWVSSNNSTGTYTTTASGTFVSITASALARTG